MFDMKLKDSDSM